MDTNHQSRRISDTAVEMTIHSVSVSDRNLYKCKFDGGGESEEREIQVEAGRRNITLTADSYTIQGQQSVTLTCYVENSAGWKYHWFRQTSTGSARTRLQTADDGESDRFSISQGGIYTCRGWRRDPDAVTPESNAVTIENAANKPKPRLTADKTIIPVGGSVRLTCSVDGSADWKYDWFRQTSESSAPQLIRNVNPNRVISVNQGGIYYCRGGRGDSVFYTENSNKVTIQETVSNKAVVTLQPNGPLIYSGETITVRCDIERGGNTQWEYEWSENNRVSSQKDKEFRISASSSSNVNFMCKGRRDFYFSTEWSEAVTLRRSLNKAKPTLRADSDIIPVGGSVTLTCSVDSSADWKYYWFRRDSGSSALQSITNVKPVNKVSEGGIYQCRAGRGDPEIFTEDSRAVTVRKTVPNKAVVTVQPNWTEIYSGETIMLRCEIHDGDTEWEYEWKSPRYTYPNNNEYMISKASSYHSGNYRCRGRKKNEHISTEWSADIKLTVSDNPPAAVLTVSPLWLSPGDSVTLSCEVEHPSAGWRFYWYKTVPKLSDYSSIYELLPGSINGTEQDSYIIHGPTHTAGHMCRAGRGDPVYYSQYSKPGFVWSGDVHSAMTLKVSPDRVQHFTNDSVSLSCEGNFTKWRVRWFPEDRYWSDCYYRRFMTGSTCNISSSEQSDAVYWCESGSGEFSNAVNITIQKADIILVSPVHPVTEGQSVTLGCKLKRGELLSNVFFYQNDKLIQNDTRRELNISAVSKSDEGFYKCKYSGEESAQSWMSVQAVSRPENSSSLVPLIVRLVCVVVFIILLILLYLYRRSKGDVCVYESIRGSEDPENGKKWLVSSQKKVQERVQQGEEEQRKLSEEEENLKSCAEASVKDCDKIFDQLISSMQKRRSEVKQLITAQEKSAITQVKELRLQQGEEIAKLRTRDALLERLLHTDDHIYLIQAFSNFCDPPEISVGAGPPRSFREVTDCVSELRDKLEAMLKDTWPRISATASYVDFTLTPEPTTREECLQCKEIQLNLFFHAVIVDVRRFNVQTLFLPDRCALTLDFTNILSPLQVTKMAQRHIFSLNSTLSAANETIVDSQVGTAMGALILGLVFLLGFPGNLFIIWSILARARKQSITTLLILNLAIADGSLMALTPFFIIYLVMKKWVFGNVMCKIIFYLCLVNMYASIQLIMLMSVYRLVAVLWPQRVSAITGQRTVLRMLAVVWVVVMVASVPAIIFRSVRMTDGRGVCDSFHDEDSHVVIQYTLELMVGFLIPYGIIVFSYICILRKIRQTKFRRRIRSEKLILAIVVTFCIFWLPYHVINMVQVTWALCPPGKPKELLGNIWRRSRAVTSSLAFMSSSANPVLYFFAGKSYIRREGLAFMARLFEGTGLESATRKSRQNSQNSRDKDKDADAVMLKDKDQDSVTNSSSNVKPVKNGK
ncbi:uncharacterized protein si:ch211-163c2.2 [Scomber scombrus]|uniref:Uncharacterized protein si:ch211-163c2.2 n=1 Tax=Scomber scombrus TaxID=13677 RepID=A0AAV1PW04_SCOSC